MKRLLLSIFTIILSHASFAQSVDDKIESICGTHPVLRYLADFKGDLMDPQILVHAEECAAGKADADVWKWQLMDIDIQGCLTRKYGHEASYIKSIAAQLDDTKEVVADQIPRYNHCANSVRDCGKNSCSEGDTKVPGSARGPLPYVIVSHAGKVLSWDLQQFESGQECLEALSQFRDGDSGVVMIGGSRRLRPPKHLVHECSRLPENLSCLWLHFTGLYALRGATPDLNCYLTASQCNAAYNFQTEREDGMHVAKCETMSTPSAVEVLLSQR